MDKRELQDRLKKFAISIVRFGEELPPTTGFRTVRNQICRSGPSSAANYRAACRGKSTADYIAKMGIVEEELDENTFFRANRQYIININYIKGFKPFEKVKLAVDLNIPEINHSITISQETAPAFRKWMFDA